MLAAYYLLLKNLVRVLDWTRTCPSQLATRAVMYCGIFEISDRDSRWHRPVKATVIGYNPDNNALTLSLTQPGGILDGVEIDVDINFVRYVEADMLNHVAISIRKMPSLVKNTLKSDATKLAQTGQSSGLIDMVTIIIKMTILPSLALAIKQRE